MGIAIATEHRELAAVVRAFLARHDAGKAARAALDTGRSVPPFWSEMAELGWLGLHVAEEHGGSGFGLVELAVVAEEMGRVCLPGPFVPTVVLAGVIDAAGRAEAQDELLGRLVAGELMGGLALWGRPSLHDGRIDGELGPVLGGDAANLLAVAVGEDLVVVDREASGVTVAMRTSLDPTRPSTQARAHHVEAEPARRLPGGGRIARHLFRVLAAAEAAGGAAACREMAVGYAGERIAFGRPIGQFQAIKHHCANMRVGEELATAAAWAASRTAPADPSPCEVAAAVAVCMPAFLANAKLNIQVHGGIGFTWEHDAHLYLRRAGALAALAGPLADAHAELAGAAPDIATRRPALDLPAEAVTFRERVRSFAATYRELPDRARVEALVESGYLFPHWPPPYGLGAGPVEQLVIDEELGDLAADVDLGPTAWTLPIVLPTIMVHGSEDQRSRWILPTMRGDLTWCQLFSEPGAGSDLAGLTTQGERADGGWLVTGQKVWTSHAQHAELGLALVRTDRSERRHAGITCMVIDMAAPGVTVRPLRQITGDDEFNEVFLDQVFVSDENVVGKVGDGWRVGRTTLSNERLSLGDGLAAGPLLLRSMHRLASARDVPPSLREQLGEHVATLLAIRAVNVRTALLAIAGDEPGASGSVTKLASAELLQRLAELGHRLLGHRGVFTDDDEATLARLFLQSRMVTIAGGTSEIVRNVIAERVLGLPRDPAPPTTRGDG